MRVVCINLDRSPERWSFMQGQAEAFDIQLLRLQAFDGLCYLPVEWRDQFLDGSGRIHSELSAHEVGCYASHMLAAQSLLISGEPFQVVLEDDAELAFNFVPTALAAVMTAPLGWDIIHLSTKFKQEPYAIVPLGRGYSLVRYARLPVNTAAYLISRRGAEKLLEPAHRQRPIDQEIRHAWIMGFDVLGVQPPLARQSPSFNTTIDGAVSGRQWATPLSKLYGQLYVTQRLGLAGTLSCWISNARARITRHLQQIT